MSAHVYASPLIGHGTTLGYKIGAAVTYTLAGTISDLDLDLGVGTVEWGLLTSTAKRRMATIVDNGDFSGTLYWEPGEASNVDFTTMITTPQTAVWEVTMTDTTTIVFSGILTKLSPSFANEDVVEADFSIAVDGAVVITPPSS